MIGLGFGLLGAALIGTSDCVARVIGQRIPVVLAVTLMTAIGAVISGLGLLLTGHFPAWHAQGWALALLSGVLNLLVLWCLVTALARGPISVASPGASSFVVLLLGLNAVLGIPVTLAQGAGAALAVFGIWLLAQEGSERDMTTTPAWRRVTLFWALGAGAAIAVRMYLAQDATVILGSFGTLFLMRLGTAICGALALVIYPPRLAVGWARGNLLWLVAIQAVLELAALSAFLLGGELGDRSGAAVGFATFSVFSSLIAAILFRETIPLRRWLGIVVVVAGVTLAAV